MKRMIVLLTAIAAVGGMLLAFQQAPRATAARPQNLVAQQFDNSSCTLAAIATHLNYRSGRLDYTARGIALAYTARYGTQDWWKDGNTSHQVQELVQYAGYSPVYGKLTDDPNDPVGRMKSLAYFNHYPVVFLAGSPEHAVVLVAADGDNVIVADPLDGSLRSWNAYTLFNRLEPEKWVFYSL